MFDSNFHYHRFIDRNRENESVYGLYDQENKQLLACVICQLGFFSRSRSVRFMIKVTHIHTRALARSHTSMLYDRSHSVYFWVIFRLHLDMEWRNLHTYHNGYWFYRCQIIHTTHYIETYRLYFEQILYKIKRSISIT